MPWLVNNKTIRVHRELALAVVLAAAACGAPPEIVVGSSELLLAVGTNFTPDAVYRPGGEQVWLAEDESLTSVVAWGAPFGGGWDHVAAGHADGGVSIFRLDGTQLFFVTKIQTPSVSRLRWADFDGDGRDDLVIGYPVAGAEIWRVEPIVERLWVAPITDTTSDVAVGDFDGDGDPDLALATYDGLDRIYRNDRGQMTDVWTSVQPTRSLSVAWGDANRVGALDLVFGRIGSVAVYTDFDETWALSWEHEDSAAIVFDIEWADLDGDDQQDIATACDGGHNQLFYNAGDSSFALGWTFDDTAHTHGIATADIDDDGDLDIVEANIAAPLRAFANDGGEFFELWSDPSVDLAVSVAWTR